MRKVLLSFALVMMAGSAHAQVAGALRAGTLGVGVDINFGITETLNARLGYSAFDYDREVEDTELTYDGELELSNFSALLDWYAFGGGFRLTLGAVSSGTELNVEGEPGEDGTYEIGGEVFPASQVGSITGTIEFGNSVLPYIGIGWGNALDANRRVTFLVDIGAIYGGTPDVTIRANCGPAAPPGSAACNELQSAIGQERAELEEEATLLEWYPVASVGVAVRF